jgi:hypothetical protein
VSDIQIWTLVFVVLTFAVYIYIAYASRVKDHLGLLRRRRRHPRSRPTVRRSPRTG